MYTFNTLLITHREATNTPAATARQEEEIQSRRTFCSNWCHYKRPVVTTCPFNFIQRKCCSCNGVKKATQASVRYQSKPKDKQSVATATITLQRRIPAKLVEEQDQCRGLVQHVEQTELIYWQDVSSCWADAITVPVHDFLHQPVNLNGEINCPHTRFGNVQYCAVRHTIIGHADKHTESLSFSC